MNGSTSGAPTSSQPSPSEPPTASDARRVARELAPALAQLSRLLRDPNVTRVAARSGISQPTLSRAMARWERTTGVQLFARSGRDIVLTPAGRTLATAASDALDRLTVASAEVLGTPQTRTLAVGFMRSLGPTVVGELVAAFHGARPDVLVTHREGAIGALLDDLDAGALDVAVVAPQPEGRFGWLPLGTQALTLVVPPQHRLAGARRVDLSLARDETFLALDSRFATRQQADRLCAEAGFAPRVLLEADDAATVRDYVAGGLGIAILPLDTAVNARVRDVSIASAHAVREVGLTWSEQRRPSPLATAFQDIARHLDDQYPGWADLLAD